MWWLITPSSDSVVTMAVELSIYFRWHVVRVASWRLVA
jgi:hypothetical protein